jgi:SMODS and SLOG-associating 2TM effector domain
MTSPQTNKIFEPDSTGELLRGWLLHCHKGRQRHDRAARRLDRQRIWIGAMAAGFAAVVGASVFTALEKASSDRLKIVIGAISIVSAVLSGLSAFLNLSERAERHRSAGVRYKAMIRELERRLSAEANSSTTTASGLEEIQRRLDDLEKDAPIVPERLFLQVDKDWNARQVEAITKANDLYMPKSN